MLAKRLDCLGWFSAVLIECSSAKLGYFGGLSAVISMWWSPRLGYLCEFTAVFGSFWSTILSCLAMKRKGLREQLGIRRDYNGS